MSGGSFAVAPTKLGDWRHEPKFNGFRMLMNLETEEIANRHQEPLDENVAKEFRWAFPHLRAYLPNREWVDAEGLQRRHRIAQGTVVVLDLLPKTVLDRTGYVLRREQMSRIPLAPLNPTEWKPRSLYLTPSFTDGLALWNMLSEFRKGGSVSAEFYEGIVSKLAESHYPLQYSEKDFGSWVKHRWNSAVKSS